MADSVLEWPKGPSEMIEQAEAVAGSTMAAESEPRAKSSC
jgi:hypothetical protein